MNSRRYLCWKKWFQIKLKIAYHVYLDFYIKGKEIDGDDLLKNIPILNESSLQIMMKLNPEYELLMEIKRKLFLRIPYGELYPTDTQLVDLKIT